MDSLSEGADQVPGSDERPNLLFIQTDDQRIGTLTVMPNVRKNFNVGFSRAFVTTPLCCPSRASFLTGRYGHRHGVRTNTGYGKFRPREHNSLGPWLQAQGYHTGFIGKYVNGYRYPNHDVPPGWDEFSAFVRNTEDPERPESLDGAGYTRFWLREYRSLEGGEIQDEAVKYPNPTHPDAYSTTLFGEQAKAFLGRAAASGKPWALFLWFNAPHTPFIPEEKYSEADVGPWSPPPSFMERNMRDKPREVRKRAEGGPKFHRAMRAGQLRLLMSVDDVVGDIFETIEILGLLEDTWGVYMSDNGFLWGEHRLSRKDFAFEESARVPFRMAVPGMPRTRIGSIVANIDVAPTLMRLAKDPSARRYDGRSLLPLVRGKKQRVRRALFFESWRRGHYRALRTAKWKYVHWPGSGRRELYNLRRDPYEMRNRIKAKRPAVRRSARRIARTLHNRMMKIRARPPAAP